MFCAGRLSEAIRKNLKDVVATQDLFFHIPFIGSPVIGLLAILTDGSGQVEEDRHYECRTCGKNLTVEDTSCPLCGGDVATYTL